MHIAASLLSIAALAIAVCLPPAAAQDRPTRAPSPHNETFPKLRADCERTSCAPSGGDACVQAAAILLGDAAPDDFWNMPGDQKTKIAVRLLEKGVANSNLARGCAYDLYTATSLLGGFSDPYRANELMAMMVAANYPGGTLRKARNALSLFSVGATNEEREAGCVLARKSLSGGGLDAASQQIAKDIVDTNFCSAREAAKN